jgi:hypothetical protein
MSECIDPEAPYCAQNYHPLPVVLAPGEIDGSVIQIREMPAEIDTLRLASWELMYA